MTKLEESRDYRADFDHYFALYEDEKNKVAYLTEENDIQRQAIQNLSAQVARLRSEVGWIKDEYETDYTEKELESLCPRDEAIYQTVKELLSSPDPGAEIRERLAKLEKVAEAAKKLCESSLYETLGIGKFKTGIELAQALTSLEGGGE